MRDVEAAEAGAQLADILNDVERGETVRIMRGGLPVARLVPDEERLKAQRIAAVASIKAIRERTVKVPLEELIATIHEGHRY